MGSADVFTDIHAKEAIISNKVTVLSGLTVTAKGTNTQPFIAYNSGSTRIGAFNVSGNSDGGWYIYNSSGTLTGAMSNSGLLMGGSTLSAVAIGQFDSTTKTLVIPRMSEAQKDAISNPLSGSLVFCTTSGLCVVQSSGAWKSILGT